MTSQLSLLAPSRICLVDQNNYPANLLQLRPPPKIYYRGQTQFPKRPVVGIIGSRNPTRYGVKNTLAFSKVFIEQGYCLCSNLQEGVSSIALNTGILSGFSGVCIAFWQGGLNHAYSGKFRSLAQKIETHGCLYSEYEDAQMPDPQFIKQNARLIAAMSDALLVIESSLNPRLVHIIQWGLELGKDIFSIPGPIHDKNYLGNHYLIKNGAKLVQTPQDVLEDMSNLI